jgi:hypothetical protein
MQIHGLKLIKISNNQASGNANASAQSNTKMSKVATDALTAQIDFLG